MQIKKNLESRVVKGFFIRGRKIGDFRKDILGFIHETFE